MKFFSGRLWPLYLVAASCVAALLALAVLRLAAPKPSSAPAKEVLLTPQIDLGELGLWDVKTVELHIENPSGAGITLGTPESSCECLELVSFPDTVAAGGSGEIQMRLEAREIGDFAFTVTTIVNGAPKSSELLFSVVDKVWQASRQAAASDGLLVSATDALRQPAGALTFIDVQGADAFSRATVRGSQNVPLHALKTRKRFQTQKLVLVGDGILEGELLDQARVLRTQGFANVVVLEGGVRAWQLEGGQIEGSSRFPAQSAIVTAWQIPAMQREGGWDVVAIDSEDAPKTALRLTSRLSWTGDSAALHADLEPLLAPTGRRLLIVPSDDAWIEPIERIVNKAAKRPVYYLQGGLEAVEAVSARRPNPKSPQSLTINNDLAFRTISGRSNGIRLGGCATCPGKK